MILTMTIMSANICIVNHIGVIVTYALFIYEDEA